MVVFWGILNEIVLKVEMNSSVKGMNFIIYHELQDLNDSYMKAGF